MQFFSAISLFATSGGLGYVFYALAANGGTIDTADTVGLLVLEMIFFIILSLTGLIIAVRALYNERRRKK